MSYFLPPAPIEPKRLYYLPSRERFGLNQRQKRKRARHAAAGMKNAFA
jgi:hypothetical protein